MPLRVWALTKLGKRLSGDISLKSDDETDILRALHDQKRTTTESVMETTGMRKTTTIVLLKKLKNKGSVKELTGSTIFIDSFGERAISKDRKCRLELMETLMETRSGITIPWLKMKQMAAILEKDEPMETMLSEYTLDEACQ